MKMGLIVLLAILASAPALAADTERTTAVPANLHCAEATLAECTRARVNLLRSLSRDLRGLATHGEEANLSRNDRERLDRFNAWLLATANKADALADSGANSTQNLMTATQQMQETQMSFNLQYLMLQESMQNDSRQFTALSNVMKSRLDTMKGVLGNLK